MKFSGAITKDEVILIPTIGLINQRSYYGYPVIGVAFAWLHFRCGVKFGVKKQKGRASE